MRKRTMGGGKLPKKKTGKDVNKTDSDLVHRALSPTSQKLLQSPKR